ncbi:MAG: thymidine phosphorylase [Deltaproteobacteria bacterium]|nr:thymidine phosphorylase [Deltaproteobacteria bacterium]
MRMYDILRSKRDRVALSPEEIRFFVQGYAKGEIPDYQAAAFIMAVFLNGMTGEEMLAMTNEMLHSGEVLDWSDLPGLKVDKHSTGGVGDKTSLILAPIVAAAGVYVPMISGRGLGHTGGTLDKLESIPGFNVRLDARQFRDVLTSTHMVLAGQTGEIAPADKKLYALRDVTATVESIPLIASSILSKKLAEGIDGLVLDVKVGTGAFMKKQADAQALADTLVMIGTRAGKRVVALITEMNQPLGTHVGNTLEVVESVSVLKGEVGGDLAELSFELAAQMLVLSEAAQDLATAKQKVKELIENGAAFKKFQDVVVAQGGDPVALEEISRMPTANKTKVVNAERSGIIQQIDAEGVGVAAMIMGAGRATVDAEIDHAAGVVLHCKVGDPVDKGASLATLYYNDESKQAEGLARLKAAFVVADHGPAPTNLIHKVIS